MNPRVPDFWNGPPSRFWCAVVWLVQSALLMAVYARVNAATVGHSVATPLLPFESQIPLIPAAAPLYASLYAQLGLPVFFVRTGRAFVRLQAASALACGFAFFVFAFFPMTYPRPPLDAHDGAGRLLVAVWKMDPAACTFPSLHVTCAWIIASALGGRSRVWRAVWAINAVLISISTLLVKQHFIVDVAAGTALGLVAWRTAAKLAAWCERRLSEAALVSEFARDRILPIASRPS
jgi:membrane-associated phospholipid phosphatase